MNEYATIERLPITSGRETATALWHTLRGKRRFLAVAAGIAALGAALGLVTPAVLGAIVDRVDTGSEGPPMWAYGLAIAASAAGSAVLSVAGVVVAARVLESALAQLRERLISSALRLPQQRVERSGTGDLVSRASDDVAQVSNAVAYVVPALVGALFTIAITLAGTAVLDWRYGLVLTAAIPLYVWAARWYLRLAPPMYAAERAEMGTRAHHVLSALRGLDTVLAYRASDRHQGRIAQASWAVVGWALRTRTVQMMFFNRLDLIYLAVMAGLLIVGFVLIGAGAATVGSATTATLFFLRLHGPLYDLMLVTDQLQSATASLARITGVSDLAEQSDAPAQHDPVISVDRVSFGYDAEHAVLHEVSLTIAPGERIALVGASGAGKTTLAALLAGIFPPGTGTIRRPADTLMITQDTHIFATTVRQNLTLVRPDATDAELLSVLDATGATWVRRLPDGLDTVCGNEGHELQPFEAQHLALARVALADPDLVILDEATAEAGSAHAAELDRAAQVVLEGRSALVIAHRLSQAAACDRIVVMERGRITESGTHTGLLESDGTYAQLWRAWVAPPVPQPSGSRRR